jgi:hypothetical protein
MQLTVATAPTERSIDLSADDAAEELGLPQPCRRIVAPLSGLDHDRAPERNVLARQRPRPSRGRCGGATARASAGAWPAQPVFSAANRAASDPHRRLRRWLPIRYPDVGLCGGPAGGQRRLRARTGTALSEVTESLRISSSLRSCSARRRRPTSTVRYHHDDPVAPHGDEPRGASDEMSSKLPAPPSKRARRSADRSRTSPHVDAPRRLVRGWRPRGGLSHQAISRATTFCWVSFPAAQCPRGPLGKGAVPPNAEGDVTRYDSVASRFLLGRRGTTPGMRDLAARRRSPTVFP